MQRMLSYIRKAIDDYSMIEDGDKIAVCICSSNILQAINSICW